MCVKAKSDAYVVARLNLLLFVGMDTKEAGRRGGKRRAKQMTDEQRSQAASHAVKSFWDALSPEQRSAEMRKRARKRKKR
jgi:hypothetical protein